MNIIKISIILSITIKWIQYKKKYDAINNTILLREYKAYEINRDIYQRYYNYRKDIIIHCNLFFIHNIILYSNMLQISFNTIEFISNNSINLFHIFKIYSIQNILNHIEIYIEKESLTIAYFYL